MTVKNASSFRAAIRSFNSRCTESAIETCNSRAQRTRIFRSHAIVSNTSANAQLLPPPRPP
ncbi:hypothetical protein FACS1894205_2070 [Alphaproteobacteria bacterium]|nr:hypothetical protein FACS1894205_2070 [Alphaproteobacteria bacterium]